MPAATFRQLQQRLTDFWESQGCLILGPWDRPLRIGTLSPWTFLRLTDRGTWRAAQVLVNRCPRDSRREATPLRLSYRHQFQVFLRPPPEDPLELVRQSLDAAGFELVGRDVQFPRCDFHVPEIDLRAVGWRLRLEGIPIAHAFYVQHLHGRRLPAGVEIAYELERLAMIQNRTSEVDALPWTHEVAYGSVSGALRRSLDAEYWDPMASPEGLLRELDRSYAKAENCASSGRLESAYDSFLRCCEVLEVLRVRQNLGSLREHTWLERLTHLSQRCLRPAES